MACHMMNLFVMLSFPLSAVLAADVHMEVRMLRRERDGRLGLDSEDSRESSKVAVQISAAADAKGLANAGVAVANDFIGRESLTSDVIAAVYDTDHSTIDGLACPNNGTPLPYEPDCEFLRDNSPYGFRLSRSNIQHHARYARDQRATTFIGRLPPNDIYSSWVLPFRIMTENPENWRLAFQTAFAPLVSGLSDTVTAVETVIPQIWNLRMNGTLMELINISTMSAFNSPITFVSGSTMIKPLTDVLVNGSADSLGLSIYAAAVLRSIGVPARVVGVNHWGTQAGGAYYWVEFWTCRAADGTDVWSFFDANPNATTVAINSAWFVPFFTKFAQKGNDTGIYAGTFNRDLPDGSWNVSSPVSSGFIIPSVDRTDFYHAFDPVTTTTTLSTIVNLTQFCIDAGITDCTTTTTTTTMFMCGVTTTAAP